MIYDYAGGVQGNGNGGLDTYCMSDWRVQTHRMALVISLGDYIDKSTQCTYITANLIVIRKQDFITIVFSTGQNFCIAYINTF